MTTPVVDWLAVMLGDDIDRARYVWRDGEPLPRCGRARVYSCTDCEERTTA